MDNQFQVPSDENGSDAQSFGSNSPDSGTDPGAQAVEALVRAIAQEFVLAFDEFHEALVTDDDQDLPKVQAAGS